MSVGAGSLKRTAKSVGTAKEDAKEVKPAQQETLEADKAGTKTVQDKKAPVKAAAKTPAKKTEPAKKASALQPKGIIKKDAAKNIAQAAAKRAAKEECVSQITCDLPTYLL